MSKAELPGGRGLEEILTSIRKSLAEKATGATGQSRTKSPPPQPAGNRTPPARATAVLNGEGGAAAADPAAADQGSPIPDQATAMANGRANGYPSVEPSLADLLADVAVPPPSKRSAEVAATSKHASKESDPLWFLGSKPAKSDAAASVEHAPAAAPGEAKTPDEPMVASNATHPAPDDVKLTQPEALRRSFPPLFGVAAAPPARAASPAPDQDPIPVSAVEAFVQRIKAPFFETQGNGRARPEAPATTMRSQPAQEEPPAGDIAPMPVAGVSAAEGPVRTPERTPERSTERPLERPLERSAEQPSGHPSQPLSEHPSEQAVAGLAGSVAPDVKPAPAVADQEEALAKVGAMPTSQAAPAAQPQTEPISEKFPFSTPPQALRAQEPTAASASPGSATGLSPLPPTQGLQAAIAQLLEPVLRQWVENTLPRLVETAIREEVTRQLSKSGGELKI